jgi:hypothetical protein
LVNDVVRLTYAANQERFWQGLYAKYPHLKPDRAYVAMILRREFARLGAMTSDQAMVALGDIVEKEKGRLSRRWAREKEGSVMGVDAGSAGFPGHGSTSGGAPADDFDFDPGASELERDNVALAAEVAALRQELAKANEPDKA